MSGPSERAGQAVLLPVQPFPRSARCPLVLQSLACGGLCTRGNLGKGDPLRVPRCIPSGLSGAHLSPIPTQPISPGSRLVTWLWVRGSLRTGGNDWPLHHQSGGAFQLLPTPTMTGETSLLPWPPSTLHADTCSGKAEGACLPLGTQPLPRGQPSVDWMPAMVFAHGDDQGASSAPLDTRRQPHADWRASLTTLSVRNGAISDK